MTGMRPASQATRAAAGLFLAACILLPRIALTQALTAMLIGTVTDDRGGVLPGAEIRVTSRAVIGGGARTVTNERGQWRLPALPPGSYALDIAAPGFAPYHEDAIVIGAGATIERTAVLKLAGFAESLVVEGRGSRIDTRDSGLASRFGADVLRGMPTRRASMFDVIRAAPGVSPTSPSSGTTTTVSAFGSSTNENQFLIDGTNFTCPCNGVARAEPGVDFIQEVQVHSVAASAEFGNVQGAVINVITRQGSDRLSSETSYYDQAASLTSQPVLLRLPAPATGRSGYKRIRYRDLTSSLGGPMFPERLWFFAGYQYLRDYDSQPGTDPASPRKYEQNKFFGKLTWNVSRRMRVMQSLHYERWANPERPTITTPFEATTQTHGSVPAVTFAHLTHTVTANTVWEVRAGRFAYSQKNPPSTGDLTTPSHFDRITGVTTGAPSSFGALDLGRVTGKATLDHYRPRFFGADHQWKAGAQIERGEHDVTMVIPTGVRFEDLGGRPLQAISSDPSNSGGRVVVASAFMSDAITVANRLTMNIGARFDHSRAISQDLTGLDLQGRQTSEVVRGLGTLYTWNLWSPRVGVTAKLTSDGRTIVRGSYGRFIAGLLTGDFAGFHPAVAPIRTDAFDPSTGSYTRLISVVDPKSNLRLDPNIRAPHTDEMSVGIDREIGSGLALAVAYVNKKGANFIGWTDIGGQYRQEIRALTDGRTLPVFALTNAASDRLFLLTNPDGFSFTYDGFIMAFEKRRSHGWQVVGSYTLSRGSGMLVSSGTSAAGAQVSTVAPPQPPTFGRDPNDLTNARGRLANDRPHMVRLMGSFDVPRTGIVVALNLQHFSGKPWAATAQIALPQGTQRILLESRGTRRLSSQSLLDIRAARTFRFGRARVELLFDVLNVLNNTAEEGLATDNFFGASFGQPTVFVDPRRAMLGVRLTVGR
jgi:hypothetical protein